MLNTFLDQEGIIGMGRRLILHQEHESLINAGPQVLLTSIQKNYWPIGRKKVAK